MSEQSSIEWTEATLNPWTGCTKVSPGCAHCYIARTPPFRIAGRDFDRRGHIPLVFHLDRLDRMVSRRRPTTYFVNSLSDLFHEDASDEQIRQVFAAMGAAPQHTFQVLTKRPERMVALLGAWYSYPGQSKDDPLPNVWLGVTIENRRFVHRANLLRQTPAAVRFISAEPLLSPLIAGAGAVRVEGGEPWGYNTVWADGHVGPELDLRGIDWLICGGESGRNHRPIRPEWARDLRDACVAAGAAFFFKQWGGPRPKSNGRELDGRTWDEYPPGGRRQVDRQQQERKGTAR